MVSYSIHVIAEYNLSGSKIICRQIYMRLQSKVQQVILRLLDTYASKIAKICILWTFWPVIQLINHLFKIGQNAFLRDAP